MLWRLSRDVLAWWLAATSAAAIALIGLLHAAIVSSSGDLHCVDAMGDSTYGEFSWSVIPPGPRCTYTAAPNGVAFVEGPGPVMTVWLVLLAAATVALIVTRGHRRHRAM